MVMIVLTVVAAIVFIIIGVKAILSDISLGFGFFYDRVRNPLCRPLL